MRIKNIKIFYYQIPFLKHLNKYITCKFYFTVQHFGKHGNDTYMKQIDFI